MILSLITEKVMTTILLELVQVVILGDLERDSIQRTHLALFVLVVDFVKIADVNEHNATSYQLLPDSVTV